MKVRVRVKARVGVRFRAKFWVGLDFGYNDMMAITTEYSIRCDQGSGRVVRRVAWR